jgi:hypothetical protein
VRVIYNRLLDKIGYYHAANHIISLHICRYIPQHHDIGKCQKKTEVLDRILYQLYRTWSGQGFQFIFGALFRPEQICGERTGENEHTRYPFVAGGILCGSHG